MGSVKPALSLIFFGYLGKKTRITNTINWDGSLAGAQGPPGHRRLRWRALR